MKRKVVGAMVLAVLAGVAAWAAWPLPPAPAATFMTVKGETLHTADFRGKVWLVNFWATSCSPCVKEMPALIETHQKFSARGFEVVAVAMQYDPPNRVAAFAQQRGLPFRVAFDPMNEIARGFGGVRVTPTSFLIDKRGRIVKAFEGAPDFARLHQVIDKLLAQPDQGGGR